MKTTELKTIWFDMDGTIADLYGVENWLEMLRAEETTPYEIAKPLCDLQRVYKLLYYLQRNGYRIGIISWTAKNGTKEYNREVRKAKLKWLEENLPIEFNEIHIVKYGTKKHNFAKENDIIFDDDLTVRKQWKKGLSINPNTVDIISMLELFAE